MDINVLVPVMQGTEELEAVTIIDLLRRAGIRVTVAGENEIVTCSRGIKILPDVLIDSIDTDLDFDAIILPGGAQGTENLMKNETIKKMLNHQKSKGKMMPLFVPHRPCLLI